MKNQFKSHQFFALIILFLSAMLMFSQAATAAEVTGTFTKKYQKITGEWKIVKDADGAKLVLGSDFKTRKAPDLKFILTNADVADMTGENAMNGAVIISPLKSNKGEQVYVLPENFTDYKTLALHCEQFSKLWGATDISAAK